MSGALHVVLGPGGAGAAVVEALLAAEQPGRAVSRGGAGHLPAKVEQVQADALDADALADACRGATVIYNCLSAPYARWGEAFPRMWSNASDAAIQAEARLVQLDNVYMYGDVGATPMAEDLPHVATTERGRLRPRLAAQPQASSDTGRLQLAAGRAPDFFGPRGNAAALGDQVFVRIVAGKRPQLLGDPSLPHTYAYLPDIGRALVTLGAREEAFGHVWHLPCPKTQSTTEIVELALAAAGGPETATPDPRPH